MKKEIKIGNTYTGIGSVGMSKDRQITGELTEYNAQHNTAVLRDDKGRVHEVIYKTLEPIDEVKTKVSALLKEMPLANARIKCINMIQQYKRQDNLERALFWTKVKTDLTTT